MSMEGQEQNGGILPDEVFVWRIPDGVEGMQAGVLQVSADPADALKTYLVDYGRREMAPRGRLVGRYRLIQDGRGKQSIEWGPARKAGRP